MDDKVQNKWLTSNEIKFFLKIGDCELMHLRLTEKIKYKKEGNSYCYNI